MNNLWIFYSAFYLVNGFVEANWGRERPFSYEEVDYENYYDYDDGNSNIFTSRKMPLFGKRYIPWEHQPSDFQGEQI